MDINTVTLTGNIGNDLELRYTKTGTAVLELTEKDKARFWSKVDKTSSDKGCWLWTGGRRSGYGTFKANGQDYLSHRVSFILNGGSFDSGPLVLHGPCHNRLCCNPLHLSSGTSRQNMLDKNRDGTMPRGLNHPSSRNPGRLPRGENHFSKTNPELIVRGESHGRSKLTAEEVAEIRRLALSGIPNIDLAPKFGVSKSLISQIVRREIWTHV